MTKPEPADRPICGEPADTSRFFHCLKEANHYGERHHVDFGVGSYTWGYVPTPEDDPWTPGEYDPTGPLRSRAE